MGNFLVIAVGNFMVDENIPGQVIPFTGDVIRKMFCGIADPFILIEWYNSIAGVAYLRHARPGMRSKNEMEPRWIG